MTIKEEFTVMKTELRAWNRRHGWDGTKFAYHIEHCTRNAKGRFEKLLEAEEERLEHDERLGILNEGRRAEHRKVIEDCRRSIDNMVII